jgi:HEAT repeat protein
VATEAVHDQAWEVRVGAAQALAAADPRLALTPLTIAAADPHADVRKAAVISLSAWAHPPAAERALRTALDDPDASPRCRCGTEPRDSWHPVRTRATLS